MDSFLNQGRKYLENFSLISLPKFESRKQRKFTIKNLVYFSYQKINVCGCLPLSNQAKHLSTAQSNLPTTIYVQNLSFLVTEIWISHNFFSFGPMYMIFMGHREQVWNFQTLLKKRVQKAQNLKFCKKVKNFEKTIIFLKVYPLCTSFTLFVLFSKQWSICSLITRTFIQIHKNWLIWQILWLKKKRVDIFSHISKFSKKKKGPLLDTHHFDHIDLFLYWHDLHGE
jgi:hypothetical protein